MNKEIHLLRVVAEFIEDFKEKESGWKFRVTIEGFSYWYNEVEEHSTAKFPALKQILHKLTIERNKVAKLV